MKIKPSSIDEIRQRTRNLIEAHEKGIQDFHKKNFSHLCAREGRMSDEYENTDENYCDWKQGNCGELRCLRAENARLLAANKDLQLHFDVVKEDLKKAEEENTRLRGVIDEAYKSLCWMLIEGIDDAIIKTCPEEYNSTVDTLESIKFALVPKLDDEDAFALQYLRRKGAENRGEQ